jgi:hypothetical protein
LEAQQVSTRIEVRRHQVPERSFWFRIAVSDGGGAAEVYLGKTPSPRYF